MAFKSNWLIKKQHVQAQLFEAQHLLKPQVKQLILASYSQEATVLTLTAPPPAVSSSPATSNSVSTYKTASCSLLTRPLTQ